MSLKNILQVDLKTAMKSGNTEALGVLRMIIASINNKIIENRAKPGSRNSTLSQGDKKNAVEFSLPGKRLAEELMEEEVLDLVKKELKKRTDAADLYQKGGRPELAAKEESEARIIKKYLPAQMSGEEVEKVVVKVVETLRRAPADAKAMAGKQGDISFGNVMKAVMAELRGKADAKTISDIVKSKIS